MLHGRACFPPAITPAAGRPARCTVTLPGDTGSVGDVAPHRQQASSRIWRVATSPTRVLQAPITQRCTRSVPLHPIRRSAPDQKGCNAYGSGAPPPTTSTNASIPFRHTQPTASDAATRPRHAHPGSEREALHQLGSVTPPRAGVTPLSNMPNRGHSLPTHHNRQHRTQPHDLEIIAPIPRKSRCTRYVALHPLRRDAPVTSRCTRSEGVQCLRIGCTAAHNKHNRGQFLPTDPYRLHRTPPHGLDMLTPAPNERRCTS